MVCEGQKRKKAYVYWFSSNFLSKFTYRTKERYRLSAPTVLYTQWNVLFSSNFSSCYERLNFKGTVSQDLLHFCFKKKLHLGPIWTDKNGFVKIFAKSIFPLFWRFLPRSKLLIEKNNVHKTRDTVPLRRDDSCTSTLTSSMNYLSMLWLVCFQSARVWRWCCSFFIRSCHL